LRLVQPRLFETPESTWVLRCYPLIVWCRIVYKKENRVTHLLKMCPSCLIVCV